MTPLDEAAIRAELSLAHAEHCGCYQRYVSADCDEVRRILISVIAAALDQARREEYRRGQDEEAAKHADCCVDREERDALRLRVETVERETLKSAAGIARRFIDKGAYANTCLDIARAMESVALTPGQPGEEGR